MDDCEMCQIWRERGAKFCSHCGKALDPVPQIGKKNDFDILHLFLLLTITVVVFIVVNNLVYCIVNFGGISADISSNLKVAVYVPLGIDDLVLTRLRGTAVSVIFALDLVIIGVCLAYAVYSFYRGYMNEQATGDTDYTEKTGLVGCSTILAVSLLLSVIYIMMTAVSGNAPDTSWMSSFTDFEMVFYLTRAGVIEEIMYRVFWIGVPMVVVALIVARNSRCWQFLLGGFGMSKAAFILLVVSSVLFGLAHLNGWGWSKVPDAALGGLLFGYIYIQYGLYASILAHCANDVMSTIGYTIGTGVHSLALLGLLFLGLVTLISWFIKPNMDAVDIRRMKDYPDKLEVNLLDQWKRY